MNNKTNKRNNKKWLLKTFSINLDSNKDKILGFIIIIIIMFYKLYAA